MRNKERITTGSPHPLPSSLWIAGVGDFVIFAVRTHAWVFRRWPASGTILPVFHAVGVLSVPVVACTGMFIGMVLAVQSYAQYHQWGLDSHLGSMINMSVVCELGPVLAATMLAGRIGSAMAAELATMRITEQVDALACLGQNPLHYLVVPRLLACVLLIPLLTVLADFMGIMGGALICLGVYHVESHYYWQHSQEFITLWDVNTGLLKSMFFGTAIGIISCHRGLTSGPGAEGVGRAATQAFVISFIAILALDFVLVLFLNNLHTFLWPTAGIRIP